MIVNTISFLFITYISLCSFIGFGILTNSILFKEKITKNSIFKYSIKVADFYHKDSAKNMSDRIINETNIKNPIIKRISNTKYRVLLGPYNDIKQLEESFNEIKSLDFENLEILKDV